MTTSDEPPNGDDSRYSRQLAEILDHATELFADRGYEGASMRELSERSGKSLAGLYYYFNTKEKLLYLIQEHTFSTIVKRLRERLAASRDAQDRIRIFVHNHIDFAVTKPEAMKVLAHEDDVLQGDDGAVLAGIKREYYKICLGLVEDLAQAKARPRGASSEPWVSARTAAMGLFGMLNWTYTWYKPRVDPDSAVLAREISDIFLQGVRGRLGPAGVSMAPGMKARAGAGAPRTNKKGQA